MKFLIIEDEIPAYQKLKDHLTLQFNGNYTHDWARSMVETKKFLSQENAYDIILSDIQLLDGIVFDIFETTAISCPIIFCSAYHTYLLDAFRTNGIAYLLKPYTHEDIQNAFKKYEALFLSQSFPSLSNEVLDSLKDALHQGKKEYKKRFVVKTHTGITLIHTHEISCINAANNLCEIVTTQGKTYPLQQSLSQVITTLDPVHFFKVNRSQIIHIDSIETMENYFKNRLLIRIKGVKEKVMTSSSTTPDFRKWLEK